MAKKRRNVGMSKLIAELDQQFDAWGKGEKLKNQKLGNVKIEPKEENENHVEIPYQIKVDNVFAINTLKFDIHKSGQIEKADEKESELETTICRFCSKEFQTSDYTERFCGVECRDKYYSKMEQKDKQLKQKAKKTLPDFYKRGMRVKNKQDRSKIKALLAVSILVVIGVPCIYYPTSLNLIQPRSDFQVKGVEIIDGNMDFDVSIFVSSVFVYGSYSNMPSGEGLRLIKQLENTERQSFFGDVVAQTINEWSSDYPAIFVQVIFDPVSNYTDRMFQIEKNVNNKLHCFKY